jgi:Tol biopolymer transport system component
MLSTVGHFIWGDNSMLRSILFILGIMLFSSNVFAEIELPDWLSERSTISSSQKKIQPADAAKLLTLEPGETEMYPQPSPDGRYLLTVTRKGKYKWISRRYIENGDPANIVTEDTRALDSIAWKNDGHVYYLSDRIGSLGLWEKISDGEGMQKRLQTMKGLLTQPVLLKNGSVIAVRLHPIRSNQYQTGQYHSNRYGGKTNNISNSHRDAFNNWEFNGFSAEIIRIDTDGKELVLSKGINPAVSPDGKWVAFAMPTGRSVHLFRMRIDGSELIQITDARSIDAQPSWSKDGKWILFTSNRVGVNLRQPSKSQWDVWAIRTDGRNLTRITFDKARDGAPRMGSDGRIYFHSDRKISKQMRATHQVNTGNSKGYHIWSIAWPELARH